MRSSAGTSRERIVPLSTAAEHHSESKPQTVEDSLSQGPSRCPIDELSLGGCDVEVGRYRSDTGTHSTPAAFQFTRPPSAARPRAGVLTSVAVGLKGPTMPLA